MTTLDERTGALLERLEELCAGGGYHILEDAELAPCLAQEGAGEAIAYLADCRCVDVRYAEDGIYCLRLLPAGRAYAAHARERARLEKRQARRTALFAFFGALAGALAGAVLLLLVLRIGG